MIRGKTLALLAALVFPLDGRAQIWEYNPLELYDTHGWATNVADPSMCWPASNGAIPTLHFAATNPGMVIDYHTNIFISAGTNATDFYNIPWLFICKTNAVGNKISGTNATIVTNDSTYYFGSRLTQQEYLILSSTNNILRFFNLKSSNKQEIISIPITNGYRFTDVTNGLVDAPFFRQWQLWNGICERKYCLFDSNVLSHVEFYQPYSWETNSHSIKMMITRPAELGEYGVGFKRWGGSFYGGTNISGILTGAFLDGKRYDNTATGLVLKVNGIRDPSSRGAGVFALAAMQFGNEGWFSAYIDGTNNQTGPFDYRDGTNAIFTYYSIPTNYGAFTPQQDWAENQKRVTLETNYFISSNGSISLLAVTNWLPHPETVRTSGTIRIYDWEGVEAHTNSTGYGLYPMKMMLSNAVSSAHILPIDSGDRGEYGYWSSNRIVEGTAFAEDPASAMAGAAADWQSNYNYNASNSLDGWHYGGDTIRRSLSAGPLPGNPDVYLGYAVTSDLRVYYNGPPGMHAEMAVVNDEYKLRPGALSHELSVPDNPLASSLKTVEVYHGTQMIFERIYTSCPQTELATGSVVFVHADWRKFLKYK